MKTLMINYLLLYLNKSPRALLQACIQEAKDEHIKLAYECAKDQRTNERVIYLLGGNNPETCPFI